MNLRTITCTVALVFAIALPTMAQSRGCIGIAVGSPEKKGGNFDVAFNATQIVDLDFSILFTPGAAQRFSGDHLVEFRVFAPSGHLYQSISLPFSYDQSARGKKVAVPTYPQPLETRILEKTKSGDQMRVAATLPVAASPIVTNGLYGTWTARAFVDGDTLPCSSPVSFTLNP